MLIPLELLVLMSGIGSETHVNIIGDVERRLVVLGDSCTRR